MIKKIHQIYITENNESPSDYVLNKINQIKKVYFDYEHKLWNKTEIEEFLKNNYPSHVLIRFKELKPNAFKCDLARYCILHTLGGYYFDVTICPEFKFEPNTSTVFQAVPFYDFEKVFYEEVIENNLKKTIKYEAIENNILLFPKKHDIFLKEAIAYSCLNVKRKLYNDHPLAVTSPVLLNRLKNKNHLQIGQCRNNKNFKASYWNNKLFCKHKSYQYTKFTDLDGKGTNNYSELWHNRQLYNEKNIY